MAECADSSDQVGGQVGTKRKCQPCEKKHVTVIADIYCGTCGEYQCKECSKNHQMFKIMEGHKLEQVNQTCVTVPSVLPVDMKGVDMCLEHQKTFVSYCVDHDILLCTSCLISNHRKCDEILELDTEPKKISNNNPTKQDIGTVLSEMKDSTTTMLNDAEKVKRSIGQTLDPILHKIDEKKNLVNQKFEELKVHVTEEIKQCEQESERNVDEVIATSTETLDRINTFQNIYAPVLDHGTTTQKFILKLVIGKQIEDVQTFTAEHVVEPCNFTFEFRSHLTELLDPENPLGALERNKETDANTSTTSDSAEATIPDTEHTEENDVGTETTDSDKEIKDDNQRIKSDIDDDSQLLQPATPRNEPQRLKLIYSIDLKQGAGDKGEPWYTGLDFLPDGRLVVVDYLNSKLCVYDETLAKIKTFNFSADRFIFNFKAYPTSVTVVSKDEVTVTDGFNKQIQILKISDQSEITLLKNIKTSSKCFSICPMDATTFLVSTYDDKRPMRMIKTDGGEEDFENLEQKRYGFDDSMSTYVSSTNMLALTDRFAHTVYLYTRNGTHLTRRAITQPNINGPTGVCEEPGGSVFVCSAGTNSLVRVSTSGEFLGSHKLDMISPYAVCMSKDGRKIAISNSCFGQRKLQIYKILY